jgi:hypothetical protein
MHPRPRPDLRARTVDGETVVLDRAGDRVHQLNATASFVWSKLDGTASPREVAGAVAEAFEVDPEAAARDVMGLLDQFRKLDILAPDEEESHGGS